MEGDTRIGSENRKSSSSDNLENTEQIESVIQIRNEFAFSIIASNICRYLHSVRELSRLSQVNKLCYEEVSRELEKRRHFVLSAFPFHYSEEVQNPSFHLSKVLDIKPYVTLLFPGKNVFNSRCQFILEGLEEGIFQVYKNQLPNNIVVVSVYEALLDDNIEKPIHSSPIICEDGRICGLERSIPGIMGLCLPVNKQLKIKQSCTSEADTLSNSKHQVYEKLVNELIPDPPNLKSTLLIFSTDGEYDEITKIVDEISAKLTNKQMTVWGFGCSNDIFTNINQNQENSDDNNKSSTKHLILNLYGPNVHSWCTVIDVSVSPEEMLKQLDKLKSRIHLQNHTIGFITGPVYSIELLEEVPMCYTDDRELVGIVKTIFSEIPFVGTFPEIGEFYFGMDSSVDSGCDKLCLNSRSISIMIMTYD